MLSLKSAIILQASGAIATSAGLRETVPGSGVRMKSATDKDGSGDGKCKK